MICCPIYHWLEVSRKVNISQARVIYSLKTDQQPEVSRKVIFHEREVIGPVSDG